MSEIALHTICFAVGAAVPASRAFGQLFSIVRSNPNEQRRNKMADNRRYFYLKVKDSFYNSETMVVLESMQDGLIYSNLMMGCHLMT